jgi:hypothetical protein
MVHHDRSAKFMTMASMLSWIRKAAAVAAVSAIVAAAVYGWFSIVARRAKDAHTEYRAKSAVSASTKEKLAPALSGESRIEPFPVPDHSHAQEDMRLLSVWNRATYRQVLGGRAAMSLATLAFLLFVYQWAIAQRMKGPNQSPQRNAGSRPSSGDSPTSETPSSLGPRG